MTFSSTGSVILGPAVSAEYTPERALDDLPAIKHAAQLFLDSKMVESEQYCDQVDPEKKRLYMTAGYSLIRCLKALMSYEDEELDAAIVDTQHGVELAKSHLGRSASLRSTLLRFVEGGASISDIRAMSCMQRHAYLLSLETTFAKVLLVVVRNRSMTTLLKQCNTVRVLVNNYLDLNKFIRKMDNIAAARGEAEDRMLDKDFRSGVELGLGTFELLLSMMPRWIIVAADFFGYSGNRRDGLELLMKAGGWTKGCSVPAVNIPEEGLRRSLADAALCVFHFFLSDFTSAEVDIPFAENVLQWNLRRYPDGVFFLFMKGRLERKRGRPDMACEDHRSAIGLQRQYRKFNHLPWWELAFCSMALWDIRGSLQAFTVLQEEAAWSRTCTSYGAAVCLIELGGSSSTLEADRLLREISDKTGMFVGRAIPVEFVVKKAQKYRLQGGRLLLPALELAYMFLSVASASRSIIQEKMLPRVESAFAQVKQYENNPPSYQNGKGYWDDFCLVHFLRGVCLRYIAFSERTTITDPLEMAAPLVKDVATRAMEAFLTVLSNQTHIEYDNYLVYYTHYELGRLLVCMGNVSEARPHLTVVASGKVLDSSSRAMRGVYSMKNVLILRATTELDAVDRSDV